MKRSSDEIKNAIKELKGFKKKVDFFKSACLTVGSSAPQLNFTLIGVALELSFMDVIFF
ncbi:hypothetical protein HYD98_02015 [Mycoplasmopsis bovis]|nr:hypothetical protein [Mycoplasmopsis bovis]QQH29257.1 hypothetical protein HYD98_02015 [Mycoplasmopsis bovis]